jgi:hypothetical protein
MRNGFSKKDTTTVCTKEDTHAFSAVQAAVVIVFLGITASTPHDTPLYLSF